MRDKFFGVSLVIALLVLRMSCNNAADVPDKTIFDDDEDEEELMFSDEDVSAEVKEENDASLWEEKEKEAYKHWEELDESRNQHQGKSQNQEKVLQASPEYKVQGDNLDELSQHWEDENEKEIEMTITNNGVKQDAPVEMKEALKSEDELYALEVEKGDKKKVEDPIDPVTEGEVKQALNELTKLEGEYKSEMQHLDEKYLEMKKEEKEMLERYTELKKELDENAEEQAEVKRIAAIQGIKTEGFGYVEKTVVVEGVTGGAPRAKLGIEPHSSAPKAHSGQNSEPLLTQTQPGQTQPGQNQNLRVVIETPESAVITETGNGNLPGPSDSSTHDTSKPDGQKLGKLDYVKDEAKHVGHKIKEGFQWLWKKIHGAEEKASNKMKSKYEKWQEQKQQEEKMKEAEEIIKQNEEQKKAAQQATNPGTSSQLTNTQSTNTKPVETHYHLSGAHSEGAHSSGTQQPSGPQPSNVVGTVTITSSGNSQGGVSIGLPAGSTVITTSSKP